MRLLYGRHTSEEFSAATVLHAQVKMIFRLERMVESNDKRVVACGEDLLLSKGPLDLIPLDHFLLAEHCESQRPSSRPCSVQNVPFMAYNLPDFFSRTRYTLPTSPLPINLILSKLPGPTSTLRTLMEFELYVLLKATALRSWPGEGMPLGGETGRRWPPFGGSTMLRVVLFACSVKLTGCFPNSAVDGRSLGFLLENRPCALGAEATRRSLRANSSLPALVAWSLAPLTASTLVVIERLGVSGGDGGTLPSL